MEPHHPARSCAPGEQSPYVCFCGHPGCIESFISGRGLAATYRALGGGELDGAEIGRRAAAGDAIAARAFALYEDRLARALALVINLVDPRVIVLGGGVSNNARIFGNVPKLLEAPHRRQGPAHEAGPRRPRRRQRRPRRRLSLAAERLERQPRRESGRLRVSDSCLPSGDQPAHSRARRRVGGGSGREPPRRLGGSSSAPVSSTWTDRRL